MPFIRKKQTKAELAAQEKQARQERERAELASIRADLDAGMPVPVVAPGVSLRETLSLPLTAEEITRRNVAYQASTEFITESLKTANTERHKSDGISLPVKHEHIQSRCGQVGRALPEKEDQKRAQGKAEVLCGCIVFVRDIEDDEDLAFYLRLPQQWNIETGRMEDVDIAPADAMPVSSVANFSRKMCGRFVGDEVSIEAPDGTIHYRILDVRRYSRPTKQQSGTTKAASIQIEKQDTFSGRGKPTAGESQALDGSRNLGYLAREGNQWGSFPLYDDMSDESDAEGRDYDERFDIDAFDAEE